MARVPLFTRDSVEKRVEKVREQCGESASKGVTFEATRVHASYTLLGVKAWHLIISYLGAIWTSTDTGRMLNQVGLQPRTSAFCFFFFLDVLEKLRQLSTRCSRVSMGRT
jgi:hypothetical protein